MHENAGNLGLRLPFFKVLATELGLNVLAMAYRGYSYSDDHVPITEEGIRLDSEAIIEFLKDPSKIDPEIGKAINHQLIFLQGRSLGGAVALHMADKEPGIFRGLIIESTFTSISDMVDHIFFFIRPIKSFILKIGWDNAALA